MGIQLTILPHQVACLDRVSKVFHEVPIASTDDIFSNPVFDRKNVTLKDNISKIQMGGDGVAIPKEMRTSVSDHFGLDVRMETGTGKTYCYFSYDKIDFTKITKERNEDDGECDCIDLGF